MITKDPDWDFLNMAWDLEKEWKKSTPKYSERELLKDVFPEAREILPEKIKEWQEERASLVSSLAKRLSRINQAKYEFNRWFWREWIKVTEGPNLLKIDWHIARLKNLLIESPKTSGRITQEHIDRVKKVPIESLINQKLRKSGNRLYGSCPLHRERTPSFCIYTATNSFNCYGCNQGGDVIKLIQLLHGYSFIEAVKYLLNHA